MKYILTTILFTALILPCNAFSLFGNNSGIYRNDIANAERILFGRKKPFHSQENRLNMIEKELFGTVQSGSVKSRVSLINKVLANNEYEIYSSPARINRIRNNIFSSRNYNQNAYKRNIIRNGKMTGFEPQVHVPPTPNFSPTRNRINQPYRNFNRINTKIPQPFGHGNNRF